MYNYTEEPEDAAEAAGADGAEDIATQEDSATGVVIKEELKSEAVATRLVPADQQTSRRADTSIVIFDLCSLTVSRCRYKVLHLIGGVYLAMGKTGTATKKICCQEFRQYQYGIIASGPRLKKFRERRP